jgi:hypothetical protein
VAAGAVVSIGILTESLENINTIQVKYTKTDESTVTLDTYLQDIVSDIEATGDHVNQLVTTLESNALTIAKINEINPYFGIDKVETETSNKYYLPRNNDNLFEYYEHVDNNNNTNIGVFISPAYGVGDNKSIFHVCKGPNTNTVSIGCKMVKLEALLLSENFIYQTILIQQNFHVCLMEFNLQKMIVQIQ